MYDNATHTHNDMQLKWPSSLRTGNICVDWPSNSATEDAVLAQSWANYTHTVDEQTKLINHINDSKNSKTISIWN